MNLRRKTNDDTTETTEVRPADTRDERPERPGNQVWAWIANIVVVVGFWILAPKFWRLNVQVPHQLENLPFVYSPVGMLVVVVTVCVGFYLTANLIIESYKKAVRRSKDAGTS